MTKKYVLTGGPGTGKSTLLEEFHKAGFYVMQEIAGYLIEGQLRKGGKNLPWLNRHGFQKEVLRIQQEWEKEIPPEIDISFQDRGIPDNIGFYRADGVEPPREFFEAAKKANYTKVFLLEPLPIHLRTKIRREGEDKARLIHKKIQEAYQELGYNLIRIPAMPLEERFWRAWNLGELEHDAMRQPEMETIWGKR